MALALWAALWLVAGCKKPAPSAEYAQASSLFNSLYAEKFDDAFVDARMAEVEELLGRVSKRSGDYASAIELRARIARERERVQAEDAARKKMVDAALRPVLMPVDSAPLPPPPPPAEPDAGPTLPTPGMKAAVFQAQFGSCFTDVMRIEVTGESAAQAWELRDETACRRAVPGFKAKYVLLRDGAVLRVIDKSVVKLVRRLEDGGIVDGGA